MKRSLLLFGIASMCSCNLSSVNPPKSNDRDSGKFKVGRIIKVDGINDSAYIDTSSRAVLKNRPLSASFIIVGLRANGESPQKDQLFIYKLKEKQTKKEKTKFAEWHLYP